MHNPPGTKTTKYVTLHNTGKNSFPGFIVVILKMPVRSEEMRHILKVQS